MEPALSDAVAGAVYAKDDLHVPPRHPGLGPRRLPGCQGVKILEHAEVHALEPAGKGRWLVSTSTEKLAADRIVVAAGMWSSDLLPRGSAYPSNPRRLQCHGQREGNCDPPAELAEPNVACSHSRRRAHLGNLRNKPEGYLREPALDRWRALGISVSA